MWPVLAVTKSTLYIDAPKGVTEAVVYPTSLLFRILE